MTTPILTTNCSDAELNAERAYLRRKQRNLLVTMFSLPFIMASQLLGPTTAGLVAICIGATAAFSGLILFLVNRRTAPKKKGRK